jgi:hypothetical protein
MPAELRIYTLNRNSTTSPTIKVRTGVRITERRSSRAKR